MYVGSLSASVCVFVCTADLATFTSMVGRGKGRGEMVFNTSISCSSITSVVVL